MLDIVLALLSVVVYQSIYQYFTIDLFSLQIIGVYESVLSIKSSKVLGENLT